MAVVQCQPAPPGQPDPLRRYVWFIAVSLEHDWVRFLLVLLFSKLLQRELWAIITSYPPFGSVICGTGPNQIRIVP